MPTADFIHAKKVYFDLLRCILKASEEEASRLYELNLLAFVPNKFDFWGPKCPNYLNIEF